MEFVENWVNCILATIILIGIVEIIVPEGEVRKFVFLVTGVIASIVISTPIIKLLSSEFSLNEIFSVDVMEDNFYYIDTLRGTVDRQSEILEEVYAGNVVERFNSLYVDMKIDECRISFSHDGEGKITEVNEVYVECENSVDDISLLRRRVADICEVDIKKVRVS